MTRKLPGGCINKRRLPVCGQPMGFYLIDGGYNHLSLGGTKFLGMENLDHHTLLTQSHRETSLCLSTRCQHCRVL